MDIELDKPGDPHWLSKPKPPVCSCELDRAPTWRDGKRLDRTPIAKLCPMHAAAPRALKLLAEVPALESDLSGCDVAWQKKVRDLWRDLGVTQ